MASGWTRLSGSLLYCAALTMAFGDGRRGGFESHSRTTTRLSGMGLPGRVLASAEPVLIADVARNAVSRRMHLAVEAGLRSAFGFLILRATKSWACSNCSAGRCAIETTGTARNDVNPSAAT